MRKLRTTRAFTLVELLVVVSIIALLLAILLPALGKARHLANVMKCTTNVDSIGSALAFYRNDFNNIFPAGSVDNVDQIGSVHWWNLFGVEGTAGNKAPETKLDSSERLLNTYLGTDGVVDKMKVTQCPLDKGVLTNGLAYEYYGTSYIYGNRTVANLTRNDVVKRDGLWVIEGHSESDIEFPDRKILVSDLIWPANRSAADDVHHWHNDDKNVLEMSATFADGHAENIERKTDDEINAEPAPASLNKNATMTTSQFQEFAGKATKYY